MGWLRHLVPFHRRASVDSTPRVGPAVPTATHRSVAGQAIPFSWFSAAPVGLGTACSRQRPSRHRSPSVKGVPSPLPRPTAVQSDGEGQDTPPRMLKLARAGLGVDGACQAAPFHRSPSGTTAPELLTYPPTASHEETAQETLFNWANCAPAGAGTACNSHRVSFHRSATMPACDPPTASQAPGAMQETPARKLKDCAPEGLGVGWIAQLVPFHRSA